MNKQELYEVIKEESKKLDGKWATSNVKYSGGKETFEVRVVENNKLSTRGVLIQKLGDKVDISELFGPYVQHVLNKFFAKNENGKLVFNVGIIKADKLDLSFEVKRRANHVDFKSNGNVIFTLNMVRRGTKYAITEKAIEKAFDVFANYLKSIFEIKMSDYEEIGNLAGSIVNYLLAKDE